MIRTREFVMFLSVIAILLVGIISVLSGGGNTKEVLAELDKSYVPEPEAMSASVISHTDHGSDSETYEQRREQLRDKVLAYQTKDSDWSEHFVLFAEENIDLSSENEEEENLPGRGLVRLCEDYQALASAWPQQVSILEQEGARLLYDSDRAGSDTFNPEAVLAQLPINPMPRSNTHCLPYDIVGITLSGAVISNADTNTFRRNTTDLVQVGYALDGLPIYFSANEQKVDECGGVMVEGQYGYVVDPDTSTVLSCFSSRPVSL